MTLTGWHLPASENRHLTILIATITHVEDRQGKLGKLNRRFITTSVALAD
ncbi:MAG: hypothetical protein HC938_05755 [Nitrospira sp.]|nr:hypothetical protein [Nitrospira sp.]